MISIIGYSDDSENLASVMGCSMNSDNSVAIRYGDRREGISAMFEINKKEALALARNKHDTLVAFMVNGLPRPNFAINPSALRRPLLGRKFYHSKGSDIVFIKEGQTIPKCDYYIEFMPVEDEFRYHIVGYQCVNASIKYGGDKKAYCRNLETGWKFKDVKVDTSLYNLSLMAVKALGLDFGAVDIIISKGKPYLLEVNTAPGLIERRVKKYAKELQWIALNLSKQVSNFNNLKSRTWRAKI